MPSYVYEITNKRTGAKYVGKADRCDKRWEGHIACAENPLYVAMWTEGIDAFDFTVVEKHASPSLALAAETKRIARYRQTGVSLYNVNPWGRRKAKGSAIERTSSRCDRRCSDDS